MGNLFSTRADDLKSIYDFAGGTFTARMETAINAINAGNNVSVFIPAGSYSLESGLPDITGSQFNIFGEGRATQITATSGSGVTHFFQVGTTATQAIRGGIRGMQLSYGNTIASTVYAIHMANCAYVNVQEIFGAQMAGILEIGTSTTKANRCRFENINALVPQGLDTNGHIKINNASRMEFNGIDVTDSTAGARTGALILMSTVSGGLIDDIRFNDVSLQSFSQDQSGTPDGKPFGLDMNCTNGNIVNVWINDLVIDHTTSIGFRMRGTGSSGYTNINLDDVRISTDDGVGINITNASSDDWRDITIDNSLVIIDDNSDPIVIDTTSTGKFYDCHLINTRISESDPTATKTQAIKFDANGGWRIEGNSPKQRSGSTHGFNYGIATSDTALERFICQNNDFTAVNTGAVSHASYAAVSATRYFSNNGPNGRELEPSPTIASAATVDLATTSVEMVTISGTTNITSFGTAAPEGMEKTLVFSGNLTVSATGTNLIVKANDVMKVIRTSSGWGLISHTSATAANWTDYTETVGFTSSADPSGADTNEYAWYKNGNMVTFVVQLDYATAGTGVTRIDLPLPSAVPAPALPSGHAAGDLIASGDGYVSLTRGGTPIASRSWLEDNSGSYRVSIVAASNDIEFAFASVTYPAA